MEALKKNQMLKKEQQEELKVVLEESAEIRKELSAQQELQQVSSDIGTIVKVFGSLAVVIVMLVLVVKKIANITMVHTSGWIGLGVSFAVVTLAGVELSNILEKKTNLSEKTCMNISIWGVVIVFGGVLYLFWDSVSHFF
jgi:hypothetical protein